MGDYGDELADHMADLEQFKQLRQAEAEYMEYGPQLNDEEEKRVRRRKRKNNGQIQALACAFEHNPHWSKETLLMLSIKTGLTEA